MSRFLNVLVILSLCLTLQPALPGADARLLVERGESSVERGAYGALYPPPSTLHAPLLATPNDLLYPSQWGLAKIGAPLAWDVVTGTPGVAIAILDTGVDVTHPDLAGKLWTNPAEVPGNGIDDDGNSYVDDVNGWNLIAQTNEVNDDDGHGTRLTGVAAAATNNGQGIAGLCWNCRIMPVKVVQSGGVANYSDLAKGVRYAADKGAKVIVIGYGGYSDSPALRDAVHYAASTSVVIAAAGDDNTSAPFYPAAYPDVLSVGGTTDTDARAPFSNYGAWVDVAAPAVAITTTLNGGGYGAASSTGQAASLVAGLAGLIWSQHPTDWTPAMVKAQILHTADAIAETQLGIGRINAANAVTKVPHPLLTVASTAINGDALGRPAPGDSASLAVTLQNNWLDATGVTGTLTTADPHVTVVTDAAAFGNIVAGGTGTSSPVYSFTVASGAGYNHPIPFKLNLAANGGAYTATLPLTVTTTSANQSFCGTVTSNQTWTSDKTYIIGCNVGIAPGYTLTIQPGTVVKFNGVYTLSVGGTLIADGTQDQPIRFMSNSTSTWGRIYFDNLSIDAMTDVSGTYQGGNILRWARIESASQGIGCNSSTPYLSHVTLTGGGTNCTTGSTPLWLQDSDITGNTTFSVNPLVGFYDTSGVASGVAVSGNFAYVADYDSGLRVINISDPVHPTEVGFYDTPGYANSVAVSGTLAYVADSGYGLRVINVFDPAHPAEVGFAGTSVNGPCGVAVSGAFAYVADCYSGLHVINVSDPAHPTGVGFYDTPGYASGVAISGTFAYVADQVDGLRVIDVSSPANPTEVGFYDTPGFAWGVAISGAFAYVADYGSGLRVINISDPAHPAEAGFYNTPGNAYGVTVSGAYAYVAAGGSGLRMINISDPAHPAEVGFYATPSDASGVAVSGAYAYVAASSSGLRIYPSFRDFDYHVLRSAIQGGNLSLSTRSEVAGNTVGGNITAGTCSLVQNTTASGGITITGTGTVADGAAGGTISVGSGTVRNNTIRGGISLNSGSALTNTVRNGGISVGTGSLVQGNDVENASGWGISASGIVTVTHNRVVGNASGVNMSGGLVQGNLIANSNGVGLQVRTVSVVSNTLTGNKGNTLVIASGSPTITANNLELNSGAYDLVNNTTNPISATLNWWGTTDNGTIDTRVYDYQDDYNLGQVTYAPVLTGPVQDAPAYVRAITLTPASPVGIETAAFDVLFSRSMDTSSNPVIPFSSVYRGAWQTYNTLNSGLASNNVLVAVADLYGNKWFGMLESGVSTLRADGTWQTYNTSNSGLANNQVRAIALDAIGNKWFGTAGGGVSVLRTDDTWQTFNSGNSGLLFDYVGAIAIDKTGNKWFGSAGADKLAVDGAWTGYHGGSLQGLTLAAAADADGNVWLGTYRDGATVISPSGTWTTYSNTIGLCGPYNEVRAIAIDDARNVWFGTALGAVCVLSPSGTWTYPTGALPYSDVYAIAIDHSNNKWFGTGDYGRGAAALMADGNWFAYTTSNSGLANGHVQSIAVDANNDIWFATGGGNGGGGVSLLRMGYDYAVHDGPQWPTASLYRAAYDFSALVSRGAYSLTVSGAWGPDGIQIAPYTNYTFTVDYIGSPETAKPPAPIVRACASLLATTLSAQWTVSTTQTVGLYRYALGTTPGGSDVSNWVTTTLASVTRANLNLLPGQTYYVSVKARNTGGIWGDIGGSNGVVAGAGSCPQVDFNAVPANGMAPLPVAFTTQTTDTLTAYLWSFGDGVTSTQASPVYTYTAPGIYTVTLDAFGPGGWSTAVKSNYITVTPDTVSPVGSLTINGGASYVATNTVSLDIIASDPSGLNGMGLSNDGASYSAWVTYTPSCSWTLTSSDGLKTIYAQVRDVPGNIATFTATITLDMTPPQTSASPAGIAGSNGWWRSPVSMTLTAADTASGVDYTEYRVDSGVWQTYTIPFTVTGDGLHVVEYWSADKVGNREAISNAQVRIDTLPPSTTAILTGTLGGVGWYMSTVQVSLVGSDSTSGVDVTRYRLNGGAWQTYTEKLTIEDGVNALEYQTTDVAGNQDLIQNQAIQVDTTPPASAVNPLPTYRASLTFTVSWAGSDGGAGLDSFDVQVRDGAGGTWTDWLTNTAQVSATFGGADGHTYHFQSRARDVLSNTELYPGSNGDALTTVDVSPPTGTVQIDGGATYALMPTVTLSLAAVDATSGVNAVQSSSDGILFGAWQAYAPLIGWTLTPGDGLKTVYVRYRDAAGNISDIYGDTIILDTTSPTDTIQINDGATYTAIPTVTLALNAHDINGVTMMRFSNDGTTFSAWIPYSSTYIWRLVGGDGTRAAYVQYQDTPGNVSLAYFDTIILDTTSPTVTVRPLPPYQTSLTFTVAWGGSDALSGIASFDVQARDDDEGVWYDWITGTTSVSGPFAGLDGHSFSFRVRARDVLGNLGSYAPGQGDTSTRVDTARPENAIAINGGAVDTTDRNVQLVLLANSASQVALSNDGLSFSPWEPFPSTFKVRPYQLAVGDGVKTVYARYLDFYGSLVTVSDTIRLNTSIPGDVGLSINDDAPMTEQVTVTLTLKAPPGTRDVLISNSSRFVAAEWEPYAVMRTWVLAYYPNVSVYQVYARFRGADGTISERYDDIITLHLVEPPPLVDSTPPSGSLSINAGAESTSVPTVTLDVLAADNPGGQGVQWMYFREWKYDPVVVQWVTVRSSGWLPYTENSTAWTLAFGIGIKYVGAWFADGANNVSNPVILDSINLILPGDTITQSQVTQYRRTFDPGQTVTATLVVTSGDADLYMWRPGSTAAPDYWSNLPGTAAEQLVFTAVEGEYLIEVHGYASSQYTLDIATSGVGGGTVQQSVESVRATDAPAFLANKPVPLRPLTSTKPGGAPAEKPKYHVYLPFIVKNH